MKVGDIVGSPLILSLRFSLEGFFMYVMACWGFFAFLIVAPTLATLYCINRKF